MLTPGNRVGVAVSGGADSVALVTVLRKLSLTWGLRLVILHVNHHLRGEASNQDEAFVRDLGRTLGIDCLVGDRDARAGEGNLEDRARRLRYRFFRDIIREHELDRVAVGHTRSDQAETVLMRLLRGAGPTGLAAIRPVTSEGIVRPLLEIEGRELREWLRATGVAWREDASNRDVSFVRNRVRLELLPSLVRDWNPALPEVLAHTARLAAEDEAYWRAELARHLPSTVRRTPFGVVVEISGLRAMPMALVRRVLRAVVVSAKGDGSRVDFRHIDSLVDLVEGKSGSGAVSLPDLTARRSFDSLLLATEPLPEPYRFAFPVPGRQQIAPIELCIGAEVVQGEPDSRYNTMGIEIDCNLVNAPLCLRSWEPGDAYRPAGFTRVWKVKELFQQARVPSWERKSWPMLLSGERIIWARRFGPAADVARTSRSETILRLTETTAVEDLQPGGVVISEPNRGG